MKESKRERERERERKREREVDWKHNKGFFPFYFVSSEEGEGDKIRRPLMR